MRPALGVAGSQQASAAAAKAALERAKPQSAAASKTKTTGPVLMPPPPPPPPPSDPAPSSLQPSQPDEVLKLPAGRLPFSVGTEGQPTNTAAASGAAQPADTAGDLPLGAFDDLDLASLCLQPAALPQATGNHVQGQWRRRSPQRYQPANILRQRTAADAAGRRIEDEAAAPAAEPLLEMLPLHGCCSVS